MDEPAKMTYFPRRITTSLKKYSAVFRISFISVFEYRTNFLIGRVRNLIIILTLYYLWRAVFPAQGRLFGYEESQIFTYVFGVHLLRSLVLITGTTAIASEISYSGKFFSYLLRPVSYLKYWFSSDLAYKLVDFSFAIFEAILVIYIFKIPIYLQPEPAFWLLTALAVFFAILLNFYQSYLISLIAFWTPQAWGPRFLFDLFMAFAAGTYFPLDVFPKSAQILFNSLPFSYLVFFPISVFLGRVSPIGIITGFLISMGWILATYIAIRYIWRKGLEAYEGGGI